MCVLIHCKSPLQSKKKESSSPHGVEPASGLERAAIGRRRLPGRFLATLRERGPAHQPVAR